MSYLVTPAGHGVSFSSSRYHGKGNYAFAAYIGDPDQGARRRPSVSGMVRKSYTAPGWVALVTAVTSDRYYPGMVRGEVRGISAIEDHLEGREVAVGESSHWIGYTGRTRLLAVEAALAAAPALVTASRDRQHTAALAADAARGVDVVQLSARCLIVGDDIVDVGTVTKVTCSWGAARVWTTGDHDGPYAAIFNHGDPVRVRRAVTA